MKPLIFLAGSVLVLALAGCEDPMSQDMETAPPMDADVAASATDSGVPAADAMAPTAPVAPLDDSQLPPPNPSSEESVQPESETLFY